MYVTTYIDPAPAHGAHDDDAGRGSRPAQRQVVPGSRARQQQTAATQAMTRPCVDVMYVHVHYIALGVRVRMYVHVCMYAHVRVQYLQAVQSVSITRLSPAVS